MSNLFGITADGTYRVENIGYSAPTLTDGYVVATRPTKREADLPTTGELFGRWTDPDTGTVYWDAVEVFASLADALDAGRARGELAIWDVAKAEAITVAGPHIIQHDADGQTREEYGNLYVEERVQRIPNRYGYGHHNEHPATTRSRALRRARASFGPHAVIRANLGPVYIRVNGSDTTRTRYAVVVVR